MNTLAFALDFFEDVQNEALYHIHTHERAGYDGLT